MSIKGLSSKHNSKLLKCELVNNTRTMISNEVNPIIFQNETPPPDQTHCDEMTAALNIQLSTT